MLSARPPTSCSARRITLACHNIPSTSRAASTSTSNVEEVDPTRQPGYTGRLARRVARSTYTDGGRPLYDPIAYRKSLPPANASYIPDPASTDPEFKKWIKDTTPRGGGRFKTTAQFGPNWLGGSVPFPANPSFKPPPPLSDALKSMLYSLHASDPEKWTIRKLGERFGISLARTEAVIRLKLLEEKWRKENKELQTGFLAGMERHLLARQPSNKLLSWYPNHLRAQIDSEDQALGEAEAELSGRETSALRSSQRDRGDTTDVTDADMADMADQHAREQGIVGGGGVGSIIGRGAVSDKERAGMRRLFFEDVPDGEDDPIAARIYDTKRSLSLARQAVIREKEKNAPFIIAKPQIEEEEPTSDLDSAPSWKFVDVGDKYADIRDRLRREAKKTRRPRARRRMAAEAAASRFSSPSKPTTSASTTS